MCYLYLWFPLSLQKINISKENFSEVDVAFLWELPIEGILEERDDWKIYFLEKHSEEIKSFFVDKNLPNLDLTPVPNKNWNAMWESNYAPVLVKNVAHILAPFHKKPKDSLPQIIIKPSMAFGTGHHETTYGLLHLLNELDLNNKTVLDMGCGSGILGIFAEKRQAKEIIMVDNDSNCVNNCHENVKQNSCTKSKIWQGSIDRVGHLYFDVIISNITKNVNLEFLPLYCKMLRKNGVLLMSGFLSSDDKSLSKLAQKFGLKKQNEFKKNEWCAIQFG